MSKITLYTRNQCMQCKMTKRYLHSHHIDFHEINIDEQPQAIDQLRKQGFVSVPLLFIGEEAPIVGFQPDALKKLVS